jgi:hypothetical protein
MQVFHHPFLEEINLLLYAKQAPSMGQSPLQGKSNEIKGDP